MDFQHHHMGVRELDLSTCHATSLTDKINAVPGLRTSTAFFTFLRANLVLSSSALASHANTPQLQPYTTTTSHFSPPYSPSFSAPSHASISTAAASIHPSYPSPLAANEPCLPIDDEIPPLSLEPLDDPVDKAEGLRLIADSVSQMRQRAVRAVLLHPVSLAAYAATLIAGCTNILPSSGADSNGIGLSLLVACAVSVSYALAVYVTAGGRGYSRLASEIGLPEWLKSDCGDSDIVLGARLGDTIVGALVLRLLPSPAGIAGNKRKGRGGGASATCLRGGRGVIRAWTTAASHRGEGIGRDLLMSAVRITKEKCGRDAEVGFAKEHANSVMLMPGLFTRPFRRDEIMATKVLSGAVAEWEMTKKKR